MAQRRAVVTLDDEEKEILKAAVDGRPVEYVLRGQRKLLKDGLDLVQEVLDADEVNHANLIRARDVLQRRLQTLQTRFEGVPELAEAVKKAKDPLVECIQMCENIARDCFPEETSQAVTPRPE